MKRSWYFQNEIPWTTTTVIVPKTARVVVAASGSGKAIIGKEVRFIPKGGGSVEFFRTEREDALTISNRDTCPQDMYVTYMVDK